MIKFNYYNLIADELRKYILKRKINISTQGLNGYIKQAIRIIYLAQNKPKMHKDGYFLGYHIHSKFLRNINRNKISNCIELFNRAYGSTYHANNSKGKSNGYTHWYTFSDVLNTIIKRAESRLILAIKHEKQFGKKKYKLNLKELDEDFDTKNCFKISIGKFVFEYNAFINHLNPQCSILLKNVVGKKGKYIYINNQCKEDPWNENLGREYTILGILNKEMRKRLFSGYSEFDIDCAIQSVMLNLYSINPLKYKSFEFNKSKFPEFYNLIQNKKLNRYYYASAFNTNIETAKQIITHLSFSPNANVIYSYCKNKSPKTKVKAKNKIKNFKKESNELRKNILDKFYYNIQNSYFKIGSLKIGNIPKIIDEEIRVNNLKLKGKGRGKKKEDRIMFRLYELIEREIRGTLMNYIKSKGIEDIYQIHDCVLFKNDSITIQELQNQIKKELNINISLTGKIL